MCDAKGVKNSMLHGGEARGDVPVALDFSVNVNPLGPPASVERALAADIKNISRYPDRTCEALRARLSERLQLPKAWILCGNGASELIQLAAAAIRPARALLPVPSFSGYRRALEAAGAATVRFYLQAAEGYALKEAFLDALRETAPQMVFLCHPNNPAGNGIDMRLLRRIAEACRERRCYLLLDECFLDFLPDAPRRTMRGYLRENPYLLIVGAFTKIYAMPGLRLGYLTSADARLLDRIGRLQPEWSVSGPAQTAGIAALDDDGDYLSKTRALVRRERRFLQEALEKLGCRVCPGEANFLMFQTEWEIFEPLLRQGILIRRCGNFEGLGDDVYRIAVRRHEDNEALIRRMDEILRGKGGKSGGCVL